jgi:hypothetical protein
MKELWDVGTFLGHVGDDPRHAIELLKPKMKFRAAEDMFWATAEIDITPLCKSLLKKRF